ncbi:hypothetical protein [Phytoactinopolyspora endophytica]|uniref:hypothetical protein n=1 Tax=Phytoactinopolyspora endophytica TaxID=1642495 RepID=UPI00101DB098|nr:hypothetical protein [Phytoactinopolyspora endophytica]
MSSTRSAALSLTTGSAAALPLDVARTAFGLLIAGPQPLSIDGRLFGSLSQRRVPLDELRERLLAQDCPQTTRDAVWAHLVLLSRSHGQAWTVGCVGVALPALTRMAATLSARFAADPADIHAEILSGFLHAVAVVDVRRPRIMLRLRWAAYRAGHAALRAALDAPTPIGDGFHSAEPPPPWGHPDLVLARAVADEVITAWEADLIGTTRLDRVSVRSYAATSDVSTAACAKRRQRAERRLVAYLRDDVHPPVRRRTRRTIGGSATPNPHSGRASGASRRSAHRHVQNERDLGTSGMRTSHLEVSRCMRFPSDSSSTPLA